MQATLLFEMFWGEHKLTSFQKARVVFQIQRTDSVGQGSTCVYYIKQYQVDQLFTHVDIKHTLVLYLPTIKLNQWSHNPVTPLGTLRPSLILTLLVLLRPTLPCLPPPPHSTVSDVEYGRMRQQVSDQKTFHPSENEPRRTTNSALSFNLLASFR